MRGVGEFLLETDPRMRFLDYIRRAPGIDPIVAANDGLTEQLPSAGYVFSATIRVGEPSADVVIWRYDEGCYSVKKDREGRDRRYVTGKLSGVERLTTGHQTTMRCEPDYCMSPSNKAGMSQAASTLSASASIWGSNQAQAHSAPDVLERHTFRSDFIRDQTGVSLWMQDLNKELMMHRAVATPRQAIVVGRAIGRSMGLHGSDLRTFTSVIESQIEMITPNGQLGTGIILLLQKQVWRFAGTMGVQGY